jgi:hypothetical protein
LTCWHNDIRASRFLSVRPNVLEFRSSQTSVQSCELCGKEPQHSLIARGMEPADEGPEAFRAFLKEDIARWVAAGEQLGIVKVKP